MTFAMPPADRPDRTVAVFRLQLFKRSEPFIANQALAVPRYRPVFTGRKVFGTAPTDVDVAEAQSAGVRSSRIAILTGSPRPYMRVLPRTPDLVHAHFGVDGVYALHLAEALQRPLVTTLHGFDVTNAPSYFWRSGRVPLLRYAAARTRLQRRGDLFVCVSEFIREQALAAGFPAERTIVHYMGLPLPPPPHDMPTVAATILHVARLVEKKGTTYLLDAVAELVRRDVQLQVVIVGEGPLRGQLEAQARILGITEQVTFAGPLAHPQVLELMKTAGVLALPSIRASSGDAEGLPTVLIEAAAQGVPVVGTRSGGTPEAILDGQTGFLIPERDAGALANRLERVLTDAALRRRLGEQARHLVEQRFDGRRQGALLADIYDDVIARHHRSNAG